MHCLGQSNLYEVVAAVGGSHAGELVAVRLMPDACPAPEVQPRQTLHASFGDGGKGVWKLETKVLL